jgi:hypothetical protein
VDTGIPQIRWAKTIGGSSIAYQDFGEGPSTLVRIAGRISHREVMWEFPTGHRVVRRFAKDLRGAGAEPLAGAKRRPTTGGVGGDRLTTCSPGVVEGSGRHAQTDNGPALGQPSRSTATATCGRGWGRGPPGGVSFGYQAVR